ncbi:MAG TPA: hypothetical protein VFW44_18410 [Bryobacteraceae bacterium]|nr:hypothetical protein [Bryobacteraceae bacterium]
MLRTAVLAGVIGTGLGAQTVAVLRSAPFPTPDEIAALESRVLQNPDDLEAQHRLLQTYSDSGIASVQYDPGRQAVRLQHILYLVQHHPEAPVSGSRVAYIYRAGRPNANPSDHDAVRAAWLDALQSHPRNTAVTLNAVRFLAVEDSNDAEQALLRAMAAEPENRELAANLGFFYAREIVKSGVGNQAAKNLEQCSNPVVLAAAGTALPNLSKALTADAINQTRFDFAAQLTARARQLAPNDPDIQGPMPLIQYFVAEKERVH